MSRTIRIALVAALAGMIALAGCARDDAPTISPPGDSTQAVDPPGLYDAGEERVRAVGILDFVDLEGGFWAVTGVASSDAAESTVIAVIANAESVESQLAGLRGYYVEVTGSRAEGASIRMAGPEIIADEIRPLEGMVAGPQ